MARALAILLVVLAPPLAQAQTCAGDRHCWTVGATHAGCCDDAPPPTYEERVPACGRDVARDDAGLDGAPAGSCDPVALEPACAAGEALACEELGHRAVTSAPARAIALFERACEGGRAHACTLAGLLLANGADRSRGLALLWLACSPPHDPSAGDPVACFHYGRLQAGARPHNILEWSTAITAHERACSGGVARACLAAAELVESGHYDHDHPVGRDLARARALRARACDLGAGEACRAKP